jgi:hypothetical protein
MQTAHEKRFCPAFADYDEVGRWIPFSEILAAIRAEAAGPVSVWTTCKIEEHEGPAKHYHDVVGVACNQRFAGTFNAPWMPEFSLWTPSQFSYDADHGRVAVPSNHQGLYKGWRVALRDAAPVLGTPVSTLYSHLGASQDRSTEEVLRIKSGYL